MAAAAGQTVTVRHLDVFALGAGGGNPCPIVLDADQLCADQMQAIAAHFGQESGFVLREDDGGMRFRFFVPRHEMAMCVHASVGAVTALAEAGRRPVGVSRIRTASGACAVTCSEDIPPLVSVEQQLPRFGATLDATDEVAAEVADALGVARAALDERLPIRSVSVSRPKLMVPVRRAADVHRCVPDLDRLWQLCRRLQVTGAYPFAPLTDHTPTHFVARQFPVDAGYPEDPATGVAAGALAAYLAEQDRPRRTGWLQITVDQGEAMGRPSRLSARARADADGVSRSIVEGTAMVSTAEELDLAALDTSLHASGMR
jgi:PhzF family phenazine biosynthesis protein